MKKAKITLAALVVLGVVGGAVAVKASRFNNTVYTGTDATHCTTATTAIISGTGTSVFASDATHTTCQSTFTAAD